MNFDITLNIRQAIEGCAQVKRLKYFNQNMFLQITHNYPYQILTKKPGYNAYWHFFLVKITFKKKAHSEIPFIGCQTGSIKIRPDV